MKNILKKDSIVIRIDEKTKISILKIANKKRRSLSDYMRILIEDTIEKEKNE